MNPNALCVVEKKQLVSDDGDAELTYFQERKHLLLFLISLYFRAAVSSLHLLPFSAFNAADLPTGFSATSQAKTELQPKSNSIYKQNAYGVIS